MGGGGAPRTAASFYSAKLCIYLRKVLYCGLDKEFFYRNLSGLQKLVVLMNNNNIIVSTIYKRVEYKAMNNNKI